MDIEVGLELVYVEGKIEVEFEKEISEIYVFWLLMFVLVGVKKCELCFVDVVSDGLCEGMECYDKFVLMG